MAAARFRFRDEQGIPRGSEDAQCQTHHVARVGQIIKVKLKQMPNQKLTRRKFLQTTGASVTAMGLFSVHARSKATSAPEEQTVYVGTYTTGTPTAPGKSEGIYIYRLNMSTGDLKHFKTVK